jgi:hypothetical protein
MERMEGDEANEAVFLLTERPVLLRWRLSPTRNSGPLVLSADVCLQGLLVVQHAAPDADCLDFSGFLQVVERPDGNAKIVGRLVSSEEVGVGKPSSNLFAQGLNFSMDLGDEGAEGAVWRILTRVRIRV